MATQERIHFYTFQPSSSCPIYPCDKNSSPTLSPFTPMLMVSALICKWRLPIAWLSLEKLVTPLKKETNLIGESNRWSQKITHPQALLLFCAETRCDFFYNLAPCLQPTYLKTHDYYRGFNTPITSYWNKI